MQGSDQINQTISPIQPELFSVLQRSPSPSRCSSPDYEQEGQGDVQSSSPKLPSIHREVLDGNARASSPSFYDRAPSGQQTTQSSDTSGCDMLRPMDQGGHTNGDQDQLFDLQDQMHWSDDAVSISGHDGLSREPTPTPDPSRVRFVPEGRQTPPATWSDDWDPLASLSDCHGPQGNDHKSSSVSIGQEASDDGTHPCGTRVQGYQDGQLIPFDDFQEALFSSPSRPVQLHIIQYGPAKETRKTHFFPEHQHLQIHSEAQDQQQCVNDEQESQTDTVDPHIRMPLIWEPDHFQK